MPRPRQIIFPCQEKSSLKTALPCFTLTACTKHRKRSSVRCRHICIAGTLKIFYWYIHWYPWWKEAFHYYFRYQVPLSLPFFIPLIFRMFIYYLMVHDAIYSSISDARYVTSELLAKNAVNNVLPQYAIAPQEAHAFSYHQETCWWESAKLSFIEESKRQYLVPFSFCEHTKATDAVMYTLLSDTKI